MREKLFCCIKWAFALAVALAILVGLVYALRPAIHWAADVLRGACADEVEFRVIVVIELGVIAFSCASIGGAIKKR